jgi:uncharacterized membrane protein YdbT with pleckstrin-like domain
VSDRASNLHRDEAIVLDLHPHWVMLLKGVLLLVAAVALGVWVYVLELDGLLGDVVRITVSILIIVSLLYLLQRWAAWVTTNFVVTTDRCIYRQGILTKRGIEIPHERINTVFFHQSLLDRMMRAGTLTIESAGENGMQTFRDVKDPVGVQQVIYQQIEDNESRRFDRGRAEPHSIADELAKLATLRDAGHLSDDEFLAQKARLLEPPAGS